jgi:hypothetical protein
MTVGEFVELVFLRVNGGKPTPENSVMRVDIRALLPAAINYVMDKTYNQNLEIEGDRDYPSEFYAMFEDVSIDRSGSNPFITLTKGTVPLKGGAGIRFVYDNCDNQYAPVSDANMGNIKYYSNITTGMGWYRRTGNKLFLYGVPPMAEKLNYQSITKIEDLADSDTLPLQAGVEQEALNLLIDWFTGVKQMPYDTLVNTRDINAQNA